jgi:uncharacterized protein
MTNRCLETKCIQCCRQTNMILSYHDIEKILKLGYEPSFFTEESDGWLQLKNRHGRCVFHSGEKCTIYQHKPEGCTLYPVVYLKDENKAILDSTCPSKKCFSLSHENMQKLSDLVAVLERERADRMAQKKLKLK